MNLNLHRENKRNCLGEDRNEHQCCSHQRRQKTHETLFFISGLIASDYNNIRNGDYCAESNVEQPHICQILKSEAHPKALPCVFNSEDKVELLVLWPEYVTMSRSFLNEFACDWLKETGSK